MNKRKKIFCFTHYDLDGMVSFLVTKWAHPGYTVDYMTLTGTDMRHELAQWCLKNAFSDFEKVFFLDLDVSSCADLIDYENVFIIDHHKTHVDALNYKSAIAIVKEYPSACLLAYKVFKKIYNTEFSQSQNMLVIYGNDYDSYSLKFKESRELNILFWNTQKNVESFLASFSDGFHLFTREQNAIVNIYENNLKEIIQNLKIFKGIYADIDGECRVVVATFLERQNPNDVSDYLLKTYDADMCIIINIKTKHVSLRRPHDGTMRLDAFAKEYIMGGGHEYSAGGTITDMFLEFTKTLSPV